MTVELQRSCKKETLVVFAGENVLTLSEHGSRCECSLANKSWLFGSVIRTGVHISMGPVFRDNRQ